MRVLISFLFSFAISAVLKDSIASTSTGWCPDPYLEENVEKNIEEKNRFVATSRSEKLSSIYTWWNILDRIAEGEYLTEVGHHPETPPHLFTYIRKSQLLKYIDVVSSPNVSTYCEIGVHAGHATVAMLIANPSLSVVSFDLGEYIYSKKIHDILTTAFPGRLKIYIGSSYGSLSNRSIASSSAHGESVVLEYSRAVRNGTAKSCDVISIDGDDQEEGAFQDIKNCAKIASSKHTVLIDDLHTGAGTALARARAENYLVIEERQQYLAGTAENPCVRWIGHPSCYDHFNFRACTKCIHHWGYAIAHYNQSYMDTLR